MKVSILVTSLEPCEPLNDIEAQHQISLQKPVGITQTVVCLVVPDCGVVRDRCSVKFVALGEDVNTEAVAFNEDVKPHIESDCAGVIVPEFGTLQLYIVVRRGFDKRIGKIPIPLLVFSQGGPISIRCRVGQVTVTAFGHTYECAP